ncbi:hypothetical protein C3371_11910 [Enterobacter cloacae complex sp. ECNIH13]|jgi:hypothetical protein|uniref:Uncharacterized protein n=1 Tax=Enterobacter hormaechei TaxID=158836 RepID=A0A2K3TCD3_9ENTR|nr:hypothetical protein B9Q30_03205 [Enterobacter hormaechei]PNY61924.1 hypothetical protein C2M14_14195 [Enterobacter cloacae]POV14825.1 hypothetical protein C3371_11910 [Enterobacter cloacae complex sp. ECNIH13]POV65912.1 hypothetical protein C3390_11670 [Enterobacter cloacae complex sp. ECNIH15]
MLTQTFMINIMPNEYSGRMEEIPMILSHFEHFSDNGIICDNLTSYRFSSTALSGWHRIPDTG